MQTGPWPKPRLPPVRTVFPVISKRIFMERVSSFFRVLDFRYAYISENSK
jgi:hypothetical protein